MEELEDKKVWCDIFKELDPLNVYIPIRLKNWLSNKFNPPTRKNNKDQKMKGTLLKEGNSWIVYYDDLVTTYPLSYTTRRELPLYPDRNLDLIEIAYTNNFKTEVEFEVADHPELGRAAKLHSVKRSEESNEEEIKKIIEQEENSKDLMSGELYKDESGLWVVWYWKEDEESFEGGKIPLNPDLQKKMAEFDFIENLIEGGEVNFLIVRDNKLCEEFMTYDYAKIVSSKKGE